jgi:hypothetical protein
VAVAVNVWTPFVSALEVALQAPSAAAIAVATTVVPSRTVTVLSASAVPEMVGVVSFVRLSELDVPLSLAASRSRVGAAGGVVSVGSAVVKVHDVGARALPARSVIAAVRLTV